MGNFCLLSYFTDAQAPRAGIVLNDQVFDASPAFESSGAPTEISSVMQILLDWEQSKKILSAYADSVSIQNLKGAALADIELAAPLLYPGTVYCAGANYRDHVLEMAKANNQPLETDVRDKGIPPWHFVRPPRGCIVGSNSSVRRPALSVKLDWEAELVAVIGRAASNVAVHEALDYVAGYTIANDLSARDLFRRSHVSPSSPFYYDWLAHKGFEGACPTGPWITPASQIEDPQSLDIRLWVNGHLKQDSNTREMIYTVAEQIAHLSKLVTLQPGDIVLTGTPAGVGAARNEFLNPGDTVRIEIERLGVLNTFII
ncbi:fumarylacetoacetate hydrolase family protein [Eoetvoesiella caeni]